MQARVLLHAGNQHEFLDDLLQVSAVGLALNNLIELEQFKAV